MREASRKTQAEIYEFFEGTLGCLAPWKNLFAEAAKSQAQNDWQYHHDLFGAIVQSHRLNLTALYEEGDRECAFAESAPKSYSVSVLKARLQQKGTVNYWARYRDNEEERRTLQYRPKEDADLKLVAYLYNSTFAAYELHLQRIERYLKTFHKITWSRAAFPENYDSLVALKCFDTKSRKLSLKAKFSWKYESDEIRAIIAKEGGEKPLSPSNALDIPMQVLRESAQAVECFRRNEFARLALSNREVVRALFKRPPEFPWDAFNKAAHPGDLVDDPLFCEVVRSAAVQSQRRKKHFAPCDLELLKVLTERSESIRFSRIRIH